MLRTAVLALVIGCAGTSRPSPNAPASKAAAKAEAPRPPAWQIEARRDAVVHGTEMTGHRVVGAGVIDVAGDRVFLQGADSAVHARMLSTGEAVFDSEIIGVPIGFMPGNVVVVLGSDSRMRLLDHDTGALVFTSDPAPAIASTWIIEMTYEGGTFRIESSHSESAGLACCAGGPVTTYEATATIDLASGKVATTQEMFSGGDRPRPPRRVQSFPKPLPSNISLSLPIGPTTALPDGTMVAHRSITITVDANQPWTHSLPPARYPRPDNRQKAPMQ